MNYFALFLSLFAGAVSAVDFSVGQPMPPYELADQHGEVHKFEPGLRWVLISFEKKTGKLANNWLKSKPETFLKEQKIEFIVEISPMPRLISQKIAIPKMRKYPHLVLVADDEGMRERYPLEENKLTAIKLTPEGMVEAVRFIESTEELESLVQP